MFLLVCLKVSVILIIAQARLINSGLPGRTWGHFPVQADLGYWWGESTLAKGMPENSSETRASFAWNVIFKLKPWIRNGGSVWFLLKTRWSFVVQPSFDLKRERTYCVWMDLSFHLSYSIWLFFQTWNLWFRWGTQHRQSEVGANAGAMWKLCLVQDTLSCLTTICSSFFPNLLPSSPSRKDLYYTRFFFKYRAITTIKNSKGCLVWFVLTDPLINLFLQDSYWNFWGEHFKQQICADLKNISIYHVLYT